MESARNNVHSFNQCSYATLLLNTFHYTAATKLSVLPAILAYNELSNIIDCSNF